MFVHGFEAEYADLAFFSGFVAGDGCFIIRENNAGASWCCSLSVRLRADNTPLLAGFQRWCGVGELFSAQARGGSAPQTAWNVGRKRDCLTVAKTLARRPPLGKARRQFDVWRRAVRTWVAQGGADPALPALAAELRQLHRSVEPVPCLVDINQGDLAPFLAGFASAEAHFGASDVGSPAFTINVRADDGPLLSLFRHTFEVGYLRDIAPAGRSRAAVSWRIRRLCHLRRLVSIFDRYPPRGRAGYVYSAWRELVMLETRSSTLRRALSIEIRRRRRYEQGHEQVARLPQHERSRQRCEEALREWSGSSDYPGSAGDYERWRRSSAIGAPNRNTIAAVYGSWLRALEANALDTRFSMPEDRVAAIRAANAWTSNARATESREAIICAVRRCIAELGHEPRATEFLRWRAERAPECPCQMTIYRRFPGGFAEVLAAARAAAAEDEAA
jgi:hypothetical protein